MGHVEDVANMQLTFLPSSAKPKGLAPSVDMPTTPRLPRPEVLGRSAEVSSACRGYQKCDICTTYWSTQKAYSVTSACQQAARDIDSQQQLAQAAATGIAFGSTSIVHVALQQKYCCIVSYK